MIPEGPSSSKRVSDSIILPQLLFPSPPATTSPWSQVPFPVNSQGRSPGKMPGRAELWPRVDEALTVFAFPATVPLPVSTAIFAFPDGPVTALSQAWMEGGIFPSGAPESWFCRKLHGRACAGRSIPHTYPRHRLIHGELCPWTLGKVRQPLRTSLLTATAQPTVPVSLLGTNACSINACLISCSRPGSLSCFFNSSPLVPRATDRK